MGKKINAINGGQKSAAHPTGVSQYRRAIIPGATYFFTLVTYRRRPILCDALALGHVGWAMLFCPPC